MCNAAPPVELLAEIETYKAVALSTGHLTEADRDYLAVLSTQSSMVMSRDEGFFVKLYEEMEPSTIAHFGETLGAVIEWAYSLGVRLVEFDRDANTSDLFPTFEW
tara:strand:+ start:3741 stop:4055 length:315 start_codon:yes stop_codon:yes gene_type:complete